MQFNVCSKGLVYFKISSPIPGTFIICFNHKGISPSSRNRIWQSRKIPYITRDRFETRWSPRNATSPNPMARSPFRPTRCPPPNRPSKPLLRPEKELINQNNKHKQQTIFSMLPVIRWFELTIYFWNRFWWDIFLLFSSFGPRRIRVYFFSFKRPTMLHNKT